MTRWWVNLFWGKIAKQSHFHCTEIKPGGVHPFPDRSKLLMQSLIHFYTMNRSLFTVQLKNAELTFNLMKSLPLLLNPKDQKSCVEWKVNTFSIPEKIWITQYYWSRKGCSQKRKKNSLETSVKINQGFDLNFWHLMTWGKHFFILEPHD